MPTKPKKVGFYYLTAMNNENSVENSVKELLSYIIGLPREERKFELGNNKFMFLDTYTVTNDGRKCRIILKSATHSYRPNLLHKDTIEERENPKQLEEGEIEKTHLVMKFNNTVNFIQEKRNTGVHITQFISYINQFSHQIPNNPIIRYGYEIVVKENFLEEIDRLGRVVNTQVVVDKQMLGSDALNFSDNIDSVKHDVIVEVRAKNRDSIKNFVQDVFTNINGGTRSVTKIRVVGKNDYNQDVILNTDFIERQEYITAEYRHGTGELVSDDVFTKMYQSLNNFD